MIVRVMSEGQYRLDEGHHQKLDELDDLVVARVEAGDENGYTTAFSELLSYVRENGEPLGPDDLEGSDFMLPPADLSFEEAANEFTGEGLIPDAPA